ncbi:MAG: PEP-CTERM sorting domain-containing protein [Akkermansiaceae bacterium]|nr:PEP-CTERM sorting domain-containing protein [Akkermansiaceae bacterium]
MPPLKKGGDKLSKMGILDTESGEKQRFHPTTNPTNNIMKKTLTTLSAGLLMASAAHAATVIQILDVAAIGTYTNADAQVVTTSVTYDGATFDIVHILGVTGNVSNSNPVIHITAAGYGVGSDLAGNSDATIDAQHGDGVSFFNLAITNFNAGATSYTVGDFTGLRFVSFAGHNDANGNDNARISYIEFNGTDAAGLNISGGTGGQDRDLTALTNYNSTATGLYLDSANTNTKNRWGIASVKVAFDAPDVIPEPSSTALLLCGIGALALLRRRK